MGVILFNLISLGIEVDIAAQNGSDQVPIWFDYMNMVVVCIFVIEITVNFIANGFWGFCCSGDKFWNFFDLVIVSLPLGLSQDNILTVLTYESQHCSRFFQRDVKPQYASIWHNMPQYATILHGSDNPEDSGR